MSGSRVSKLIDRESRGIVRVLPFLVLAVICASLVGPVLSSTAAPRFQSPISPLSPVLPSAPVSPIKVYPTEIQPYTPPETSVPAAPTKAVPEKVPPPKRTITATLTAEVPVQTPQQVPPTISPAESVPEPATPPTLWVFVGLVVVGGIIAALVVFRKK